MSNDDRNNGKAAVTSRLHSRVYTALVGFALLFALAVWGFAGPGEIDYLLVIVSGFICVVVALQLIMARVPRVGPAAADDATETQSFRRWVRTTFDTGQDQLSGAEAATLILLPIAAAAIGMMVFGIIFQIVEHAAT